MPPSHHLTWGLSSTTSCHEVHIPLAAGRPGLPAQSVPCWKDTARASPRVTRWDGLFRKEGCTQSRGALG